MKLINLIIICCVFFASCTNVQFADPQPKSLDSLTEIPEKFQGTFIEVSSDTTTYVVTATSISENDTEVFSMDSTMVVKGYGNTLYLNFISSHGFNCHRITLARSFNYEKINISSIRINDSENELKNIKYEKINTSTDPEAEKMEIIIKDINYNQLQSLFDGSGQKEELIRIK